MRKSRDELERENHELRTLVQMLLIDRHRFTVSDQLWRDWRVNEYRIVADPEDYQASTWRAQRVGTCIQPGGVRAGETGLTRF